MSAALGRPRLAETVLWLQSRGVEAIRREGVAQLLFDRDAVLALLASEAVAARRLSPPVLRGAAKLAGRLAAVQNRVGEPSPLGHGPWCACRAEVCRRWREA